MVPLDFLYFGGTSNGRQACFLTDGKYDKYLDQGDKEKGMKLLVWNGQVNANRTCELTIID
jgi:hypothetical protein